jgi:hypothetical protein
MGGIEIEFLREVVGDCELVWDGAFHQGCLSKFWRVQVINRRYRIFIGYLAYFISLPEMRAIKGDSSKGLRQTYNILNVRCRESII